MLDLENKNSGGGGGKGVEKVCVEETKRNRLIPPSHRQVWTTRDQPSFVAANQRRVILGSKPRLCVKTLTYLTDTSTRGSESHTSVLLIPTTSKMSP